MTILTGLHHHTTAVFLEQADPEDSTISRVFFYNCDPDQVVLADQGPPITFALGACSSFFFVFHLVGLLLLLVILFLVLLALLDFMFKGQLFGKSGRDERDCLCDGAPVCN